MSLSVLFEAQCAAKRGELELRAALAKAIWPDAFLPHVADSVKQAWVSAREAEGAIYRAIQLPTRPANVVDLAGARARRSMAR